jgi:stage III sporulation protein SpoIIIAA
LIVEQGDIDHILEKGQFRFGPDNRAALAGQLHRISAMRDRFGKIYGLTLRFGRHVTGNAGLIHDILRGSTKSILILGPPGAGKTTLVRDIARVLSEECANAVIVDTSNEIGGDGEQPHRCVGLARRMMVPSLDQQGAVMVECVQNHTPHVMIVDEIGRPDEVAAAGTIKNRGVRLVASAHGDLRGLVANAGLNGLIGGVQAVTIGDGLAKQRASAKTSKIEKVVTQRVGPPIFDIIIELDRNNKHEWKVITEPSEAVDAILNGDPYSYELRSRNPDTFDMSLVRHSEG